MRQNRDHDFRCSWPSFVLFLILICSAAVSLAQKTVVQDAGGGRKLEFDYNAAGQVMQQRTIGADGKLLQRVEFEYRPGFFGADQTNTTYWPDGKINQRTLNTYDASSNFTGEFVQAFDESGKQIAGHRLTHDPMTNVYTCADWNVAAQNYKSIECPAGEEGGGAEEVKKFTYDEVMQHLNAARKAAGEGPKLQPKTSPSSTANAAKGFGLVVPMQVHPGERVSGRVVVNPAEYEGMAGVAVIQFVAPVDSAGQASTLADWTVEVPGEGPQRADGPITFTVPGGGSKLNLTFKPTGNSAHSVSKLLSFPRSGARKSKAPAWFEAPALCLKGQLCTVVGPFRGDSGKTFAAFEDRPAMVVAETPDTAYILVPDLTEPGPRPLFIAEGSKVVALPVAVGEFTLKNGNRELQPGQTLITFPMVEGPGDIPDAAWRPGNFPATNLEEARKLIAGFQLPQEKQKPRENRETQPKQEAKEKPEADEKKGGTILLVVKNLTPAQVSMRGAKDQMIVFHLNDESFSRGEFKYDLIVDAIKAGHFAIRGYVIPFLAPVRGQEFSINTSAGK